MPIVVKIIPEKKDIAIITPLDPGIAAPENFDQKA